MFRCIGELGRRVHISKPGDEETLIPLIVREVLKPDGHGIRTEIVQEARFCPKHVDSAPAIRVVTLEEQVARARHLAEKGVGPEMVSENVELLDALLEQPVVAVVAEEA